MKGRTNRNLRKALALMLALLLAMPASVTMLKAQAVAAEAEETDAVRSEAGGEEQPPAENSPSEEAEETAPGENVTGETETDPVTEAVSSEEITPLPEEFTMETSYGAESFEEYAVVTDPQDEGGGGNGGTGKPQESGTAETGFQALPELVVNGEGSVVLGSRIALTATLSPADPSVSIQWKCSSPYVSLSQSGMLTAKSLPEEAESAVAEVIASCVINKKTVSASKSITIQRPAATRLFLSNSGQLSLTPGASLRLSAGVLPEQALQSVLWTSSDTGLAKVSSDGLVSVSPEAEKGKTFKITATTKAKDKYGKTLSDHLSVKIVENKTAPSSVRVSEGSTFLPLGGLIRLRAVYSPTDAVHGVIWTISPSPNFILTAKGDGEKSVSTGPNGEGFAEVQGDSITLSAALVEGKSLPKGGEKVKIKLTTTCTEAVVKGTLKTVSPVTCEYSLTVKPVAVSRITILPSDSASLVVAPGEILELTEVARGSLNGVETVPTNGLANWSIPNTKNLTISDKRDGTYSYSVSSTDKVYVKAGEKNGSYTVSAKAADGSGKSTSVRVTVATPLKSISLSLLSPKEQKEDERLHKEGFRVADRYDFREDPSNSETNSVNNYSMKLYLSWTGDPSMTLIAFLNPESASDRDLSWSSSDPLVAYVNNGGKVTPKSPGTTDITALSADGTKKAVCRVTVLNMATNINLSEKTITLRTPISSSDKGDNLTVYLSAEVVGGDPEAADSGFYIWTVKDPSVAGIGKTPESAAGGKEVKGCRGIWIRSGSVPGQTSITLESRIQCRIGKLTCNVVVTGSVAEIRDKSDTYTKNLILGERTGFSVNMIGTPAKAGINTKYTVTSLDPSVVGVSEKRDIITGLKEGLADVIVSSCDGGGASKTYRINVINPARELKLKDIALEMDAPGASQDMKVYITTQPEEAKYRGVTKYKTDDPNVMSAWKSSQTKVGVISTDGVFTPKAPGETKITFCYTSDRFKVGTQKEVSCWVKVVEKGKSDIKVTLDPAKVNRLAVGSCIPLKGTISPCISGAPITWMSNDKTSLLISADPGGPWVGELTAPASLEGVSVIYVKCIRGGDVKARETASVSARVKSGREKVYYVTYTVLTPVEKVEIKYDSVLRSGPLSPGDQPVSLLIDGYSKSYVDRSCSYKRVTGGAYPNIVFSVLSVKAKKEGGVLEALKEADFDSYFTVDKNSGSVRAKHGCTAVVRAASEEKPDIYTEVSFDVTVRLSTFDLSTKSLTLKPGAVGTSAIDKVRPSAGVTDLTSEWYVTKATSTGAGLTGTDMTGLTIGIPGNEGSFKVSAKGITKEKDYFRTEGYGAVGVKGAPGIYTVEVRMKMKENSYYYRWLTITIDGGVEDIIVSSPDKSFQDLTKDASVNYDYSLEIQAGKSVSVKTEAVTLNYALKDVAHRSSNTAIATVSGNSISVKKGAAPGSVAYITYASRDCKVGRYVRVVVK